MQPRRDGQALRGGTIIHLRPTSTAGKPDHDVLLVVAHKHTTTKEILLWMIPSEPPKALQASECSELLDPMRASCQIPAQH